MKRSTVITKVIRVGRYFGKGIRLMVGMPDYSTYVAHMMSRHPEQQVMSYQEFFRERQEARFGGKVGRWEGAVKRKKYKQLK